MTGTGEALAATDVPYNPRKFNESFTEETPQSRGVISRVDLYSMEPKPRTHTGGLVTLVVLAGTAAYIGFVIYGYIKAPAVVITAVLWSASHGPYPAQFYCTSLTGCWVSNHYATKWLQSGVEPVASQSACAFVPYGPNVTRQFDISFSTNPLDGLSIIFQPDQTDLTQPKGLGYGFRSDCACPESGDDRCISGIFYMDDPGGAGIASLYYVETHNETAAAPPNGAPQRREWFVTPANRDGTIDWSSTTCTPDVLPGNASSYVQGRLRMEPSFTELTVHKDGWLALWGIAGGAYAVFLQIGAMILMLTAAASFLTTWWEGRRLRRVQNSSSSNTQDVANGHMQLAAVDSSATSISAAADSRPQTPKQLTSSPSGARWSAERGTAGSVTDEAASSGTGRTSSPGTHGYAAGRQSSPRGQAALSMQAPSSAAVEQTSSRGDNTAPVAAERGTPGLRSQSGSRDLLLRPGLTSAPVTGVM